MPPDTAELWRFFPWGYLLTVAIEAPVLLLGLSRWHAFSGRLIAAFWLTACTYPIVVLVLPELIWRPLGARGYWSYLAIAETFAPTAECALFAAAYWMPAPPGARRADLWRDMLTIAAANLMSFLLGGWLAAEIQRWQ